MESPSTTELDVQPLFREQMEVVEHWAYFDHASIAPLPRCAKQAITDFATDVAHNGAATWSKRRAKMESIRRSAARLVNAQPTEVALIRSTTEGIGLIAEGFPWQPGDNVVVPANEFPSNLFPWKHLASRGVELREVAPRGMRIDLKDIEAACDQKTRIIACSWVGYATGFRINLDDLAELAHRQAALLMVDGIQGAGVIPLDVRQTPIDFLVADGHKWLLGPEGAGLMFIREQHLDRLRPLGVGWNSVAHAGKFGDHELTFKDSAARYEGGTYAMPGLLGFGASLQLFKQAGIDHVYQQLMRVREQVCQAVGTIGCSVDSVSEATTTSGLIAIEVPDRDPVQVREVCREHGVIVNARGCHVRLSPHVYNDDDDISKLVEALKRSM